jgi:putative integrase
MAKDGFGSIRKLPSGKFQARYNYRDGSYKAPATFRTRALAQRWLNNEQELIVWNKWTPPQQREQEAQAQHQRNTLTVGKWLEQYHDSLTRGAHPIRQSALQTYLKTTRNRIWEPIAPGDTEPDITRLQDIPLAELTKGDVYRWWDGLNRVYDTPETNRKAYQRLKAACAEAVRRELIPTNPVDIPVAGRKVKRDLPYLPDDDELQAVVDGINPRYRLLTVLCLFHALRVGEAIALEQDCFTSDTPVPFAPRYGVRVEQNAQRISRDDEPTYMLVQPPKSDAGYRIVPFMSRFNTVLWEHLAEHMDTQPVMVKEQKGTPHEVERPARLLTTTARGQMMMDTSYRSVLERVVKRVKVSPEVKPHSGRRWLATRLAERGAHVKEIAKILGDNDLDVIMSIYMQVRAERTVELMDTLSGDLD